MVSGSGNKYKFTGKERDTETGYDYFGARYYDSKTARWNSVDPLADKYPGWSPYNYTLNNPLKYVDPNGMWVVERDEHGNIITKYEDGDTYENLYSQLGMSAEQFASWTASQGIELSLDGSGMSFNITDFVVSNNNFEENFSGSNCHGFVAFATGSTPVEGQIGGQDLLTKLGSPSQTSTLQTGNVAVFSLDENLVQNDGTITLTKGDPAHSAIFVLKNQSGDAQYLNRINSGQPVSISSGSQIVSFFNNLSQQYAPFVRQMPNVVPNPSFYKVR